LGEEGVGKIKEKIIGFHGRSPLVTPKKGRGGGGKGGKGGKGEWGRSKGTQRKLRGIF